MFTWCEHCRCWVMERLEAIGRAVCNYCGRVLRAGLLGSAFLAPCEPTAEKLMPTLTVTVAEGEKTGGNEDAATETATDQYTSTVAFPGASGQVGVGFGLRDTRLGPLIHGAPCRSGGPG